MARNNMRKKKNDEQDSFLNSLIVKFSSKVLLGVIVILVFLSISQCTIKSPESPSWNTNFVLPVINKTYDMEELLSKVDQDEINMDSAGVISISITKDLQAVGISSTDFSIPNISDSVGDVLGIVSIDQPTIAPVTLKLNLISGLAAALPGDSAIIPSDSFSVFNEMPQVTNFSQITVSSGYITASIDNNLGFDISSARITVFDIINFTAVASSNINTTIFDGTSANIQIPLTGRTLSNRLRMDVVCITPGGTVYNFSLRDITTGISFSDPFELSSGTAKIPALADKQFSQTIGINLSAGEKIDSAKFSTGSLNFNIVNNTQLETLIEVTIPNLLLNGTPFTMTKNVLGNQSLNVSNDLSNYDIIPSNDSVNLDITIGIPGSGASMVDFALNDNFYVKASMNNLNFESVSGVFNNNSTILNESVQDLNIPEGFDDIGFVNAVLTLDIENAVDLPGNLVCTLLADNGNSLILSGTIAARGAEVRQLTTITNNNVGDFLSPLPGSIDIRGEISFGDNQSHTISLGDSVFSSVSIYAPMYVKVNNAEVSDLDMEKTDIAQEDITIITDHLVQAKFIYDITNHLPLGITAIIHLSGDSTSLYNTPQLSLDTIKIDAAPVSPSTGLTTGEIISSGEIFLDSVDIQVLNNDSLFIRHEIFLNGSDPAGVQIVGSDFITITGRIEIEYLFNGEF